MKGCPYRLVCFKCNWNCWEGCAGEKTTRHLVDLEYSINLSTRHTRSCTPTGRGIPKCVDQRIAMDFASSCGESAEVAGGAESRGGSGRLPNGGGWWCVAGAQTAGVLARVRAVPRREERWLSRRGWDREGLFSGVQQLRVREGISCFFRDSGRD
jgi:hypothetical protein